MKARKSDYQLKKALALFRKRSYRAAEVALQKILAADPNNYEALFYQALSLYENGKVDQSLSIWRIIKKMGPKQKNVNLNLGCAYHRLGRLDLAIRSYKQELVLYPLCGEALYSLGTLYYHRRQFALAIPYLETCLAIKHCPKRIMKRLALCYFARGRIRDEQLLYENWLLTNPRDSWVLNNLGAATAQAGEFNRAELCFRRASTIASHDACILRNLRKARLLRIEGVGSFRPSTSVFKRMEAK